MIQFYLGHFLCNCTLSWLEFPGTDRFSRHHRHLVAHKLKLKPSSVDNLCGYLPCCGFLTRPELRSDHCSRLVASPLLFCLHSWVCFFLYAQVCYWWFLDFWSPCFLLLYCDWLSCSVCPLELLLCLYVPWYNIELASCSDMCSIGYCRIVLMYMIFGMDQHYWGPCWRQVFLHNLWKVMNSVELAKG